MTNLSIDIRRKYQFPCFTCRHEESFSFLDQFREKKEKKLHPKMIFDEQSYKSCVSTKGTISLKQKIDLSLDKNYGLKQ